MSKSELDTRLGIVCSVKKREIMPVAKKTRTISPPVSIAQVMHGGWAVRSLKTAVELNLFAPLEEKALTAGELAEKLSVDEKGLGLLLDVLVGMEILHRLDLVPMSQLNAPTYALSDTAGVYLLPKSPLYMGGYFKLQDELDRVWANLTDVIKSGKPVMEVNQDHKAEEIFPKLAEAIFPLSYAIAVDAMEVIRERMGDKGLAVLDLACGSGVWSIPLAQDNSRTRVDALDFPAVLEVTEKITRRFDVHDQYRHLPGNWRDVTLTEKYDVIVLGHILHSEGFELSVDLLKTCFEALNEGGILLIAEFFTNRSRTAPLYPLMFALNMFLATTSGCVFSRDELTAICLDVGFSRVIKHSQVEYASPLLLAVK